MIRVLFVFLLLAAAGAAAFASMGAGDDGGKRYRVELDNAFGLVDGADVKVAGVRAGKIKGFAIDRRSYRALVDIQIDQGGFGDLRSDVFCESRPQSLIGEYFLDCKPGTSERKLENGARIPVTQTGSTIPVDLVNNIMRRPYRERFSIIVGELGAALAARGTDLNETIRRANPALRETDKVLAELAAQRRIIADLTTNADRVVTRLADKRTEVTRFITEARDTARASAERREDIRAQLQRFPTFLRELRPTMARLGEAADAQTPALRTLSAQAPLLTRFFDTLGPFSEASRPAFRTLAAAADTGRETIPVARPQIRQLAKFAEPLPELTENLAITLEHLDDRKFAVEKDPRSPGGQGFTGFEAILSYIFRQSQATNLFDDNSYLLKVSAFLDEKCAQYADAEQAKDRELDRCLAALGPGRPGIDEQVAASSRKSSRSKKTKKRSAKKERPAEEERARRPGAVAPRQGADPALPAPAVPNVTLPSPTAPNVTVPGTPVSPLDISPALDYLLAP